MSFFFFLNKYHVPLREALLVCDVLRRVTVVKLVFIELKFECEML